MSMFPPARRAHAKASVEQMYSAALVLGLLAVPLGLGACTASGELVASYPVVEEVQTVPVQVEAYPRVAYAGARTPIWSTINGITARVVAGSCSARSPAISAPTASTITSATRAPSTRPRRPTAAGIAAD